MGGETNSFTGHVARFHVDFSSLSRIHSMSVISVCICTRHGRLVLSRQYSPISKARLEGLIVAFPKFIDKNQQHTYVETETYRYLYSLLGDSLYLILLTDRNSNMIQDMTLLRTLFELTQLRMHNVLTEESAVDNGFDILFTYDECISTLGHPEMMSVDQVESILKMESHEENIQDMIVAGQILEAQKKANDAAEKISRMLKENDGRYATGIASRGSDAASGASSVGGVDVDVRYDESSGRSSPGPSRDRDRDRDRDRETAASARSKTRRRGLVLGSSSRRRGRDDAEEAASATAAAPRSRPRVLEQQSFLAEMGISAEDESLGSESPDMTASSLESSEASASSSSEPVSVVVRETVSAEIDNGVEEISMSVRGKLDIAVRDAVFKDVLVRLQQRSGPKKQFSFKNHPKTDRQLFSREGVIGLKQGISGFRVGGAPLTVLTWKLKPTFGSDEGSLPVLITCWPNESSDGMTLTIEFEIQRDDLQIHDLGIRVPLPQDGELTVDMIEVGTYKIRQGRSGGRFLVWRVPLMGGEDKGSLEFTIDEGSEDSFFPIEARFATSQSFCGLGVESVVLREDPDAAPVSVDSQFICDVERYALMSN